MKVFFSSEQMVWLSLTPIRMAAKLVPCSTIRTGVVQSYASCTFLTCPRGGLSGLLFFMGLCWNFLFLNNINNIVHLIWESHLQNCLFQVF